MPTIADLFKSKAKEIYNSAGAGGNIYIQSRGFINVNRSAALLASSPKGLGDLIGGAIVSATIGGTADRPSDTVFRGTAFFNKPVTLPAVTQALYRDIIKKDKQYFIKEKPTIGNMLGGMIKSLTSGASAQSVATDAAQKALNTFGSPSAIKNLAKSFKKPKSDGRYGTKFSRTLPGAKPKTKNEKFSDYEEIIYTDIGNKGNKPVYSQWNPANAPFKTLKERGGISKAGYQGGLDKIQNTETFKDNSELQKAIQTYKDVNQVWVTFQKYGNSTIVPFVGAITGINEDVTPEWQGFRYVGSPFKVYRYAGVERSLKFEMKLYYLTIPEKGIMIKKINYLKSLAFPNDTISQIDYKTSDDKVYNSQYAFSPNLVKISIGDLYKNILGYVDNLSFTIEDNTSWPSTNGSENQLASFFGLEFDKSLYPSVINVSIGLKIIENHSTETKSNITKYKYDFDGNTYPEFNQNKSLFSTKSPYTITETTEPKVNKENSLGK